MKLNITKDVKSARDNYNNNQMIKNYMFSHRDKDNYEKNNPKYNY